MGQPKELATTKMQAYFVDAATVDSHTTNAHRAVKAATRASPED